MQALADRVDAARERMRELQVVVLPDFFLDHFIALDSHPSFQEGASAIHGRGGGNLITGPQAFRVGGNAANTVYALARLGVSTTLVTRTDPIGGLVLRAAFEGLPVDPSCIQIGTHTSATAALEFPDANVMLSAPGPLAHFGPDDLEAIPGAWERIERADAVVVTNWSQTLEHGTHLLEAVCARARENDAFTFLDTGDPTHRGEAAQELLRPDGPLKDVSAWGMNENELRFFAERVQRSGPSGEDAELQTLAGALRSVYPGRLDVHTAHSVFSLEGDEPVGCGTFMVEPLRLTGSGDAWNAGNLLGQLLGLETPDRLCVANAVAALTITAEDGSPPTRDRLVRFLRKRPVEERAASR